MALRIAQVATTDVSIRLLLLDQIKSLEAQGHEVVAVEQNKRANVLKRQKEC